MNENRPSLSLLQDALENMRQIGLGTAIWDRPVSPQEIEYFLDRWPFLQIVSANQHPMFDQVEQLFAPSGWVVLSYGDAMTSSPGRHLFGPLPAQTDDQDGEGDGDTKLQPLHGTVWRQAIDTAEFMAATAHQLGWTGIHVVDGHPMMEWAVWNAAVDLRLEVTGFEPSIEDYDRRARVKRPGIADLKFMQPGFTK